MKIMKASAGSGKTYRLAHRYMDILLSSDDRYAYRHVLAVTFTNKATAEMKARILKLLHRRAETDPRARRLLSDMLHDYGAFSVSTIDKFFQQALKSFSREIGQFADYQIELDRKSLIAETMDRILDSLTEDSREIVDWLKASLSDTLEQGRRFNLEEALYEIGERLKSEEHREKAERSAVPDAEMFSKERLLAVRRECRSVIEDFTSKAKALGIGAEPGKMIQYPLKRVLKAGPPELEELFDEPYRRYCTMWMIDELIYSLGLAGEFYREFDALLKEKNVMCLDESNTILRDIIDGSDAPFVYEKMGTRYDHFLLDEFQDTSNIQWENFLPLLRESEARGGKNLIVGDVKQSIYRWRNSDWELLDKKVGTEFPGAEVEVLDGNWRSARRIVSFNNSFFRYASSILGLQDLYADVEQKVRSSEPQEGCVRLSFVSDQEAEVLSSILDALERGAGYGDIAVLVRNRKEGSSIASYLVGHGIPVISDDSLSLKSSAVVRRLVSLLSCIWDPDDSVGGFLVESMDITIPGHYHSLTDLCEALLRELRASDPASFEGETLFIQAFLDELRSWADVNGSDLGRFLKHWDEADLCIGSPESDASVRILTVHKAKGLEYPCLIFPYAEKVDMYKAGVHWCSYDDFIFPVSLSAKAERTLFDEDYRRERMMQLVDNINVFYVALTRARCDLHVIARAPSKKCRESVGKSVPEFSNFSELLYHFTGGSEKVMLGEPYDFTRMRRDEPSRVIDFPGEYLSIPIGTRLKPSAEASDFFSEDGVAGVLASPRLSGILLHDILSRVRTPSDLHPSIAEAVCSGDLAADDAPGHEAFLSERIAAHPDWFEGDCRNEVAVFDGSGAEYRPDKVVLGATQTIVIDYKFGEESPSHLRQVGRYVKLYRELGYPAVRGVVWYVREDRVVPLT